MGNNALIALKLQKCYRNNWFQNNNTLKYLKQIINLLPYVLGLGLNRTIAITFTYLVKIA